MPPGPRTDRFLRPLRESPYLLALAVGTGLFFLSIAILYVSRASPTGDEPHYLVISETLLKYHSIDVARAYQNRDYLGFYNVPRDRTHPVTNNQGRHVPVHGIGGPVLWLPLFAVAGRMGAILFVAGVS